MCSTNQLKERIESNKETMDKNDRLNRQEHKKMEGKMDEVLVGLGDIKNVITGKTIIYDERYILKREAKRFIAIVIGIVGVLTFLGKVK